MKIVIVGAGGQGRIVAEILRAAHDAGATAEAVGFVDDTPSVRGSLSCGLPIHGSIDDLETIEHDGIVIAVGDNLARRVLTARLVARGERLHTARHPFSFIGPDVQIGEGSMISAGAIVTAGAILGRGVLLNTKASVDHNSVIGDYAHVSAGATVGAECSIGDQALIAIGAVVVSRRKVGARTTIAAGAVVVRDIGDDVVAYGVPARVTSDHRSETPTP